MSRVNAATNSHTLTDEEWAFAQAMHAHKQRLGTMTLPWSEVLKVAKSLGYEKVRDAEPPRTGLLPPGEEGARRREAGAEGGAEGPPAG